MLFFLLTLFASETQAYVRLVFRESPLAPLAGAIPLSESQLNRNHYLFSRDGNGRITKVEFRTGQMLRAPNDTAGLFFHEAVLYIRYEGNREIRWYSDRFGNRVPFWGGVFEEEYTSIGGKRVSLVFKNQAGELIENSWGIARYDWDYPGDGAIIETRHNLKGEPVQLRPGFDFGTLRLIYDERGFLDRMQNIDDFGKLVANSSGAAQDKLEYGKDGTWLAWNVLDEEGNLIKGNGPNVARGVLSYNELGDEIGIIHYDELGNPMVNHYGFCASESKFDQFGNLIGRTFLDEKGDPEPHQIAGYQSMILEWDPTGMHRLSLRYFGADGMLFDHQTRGYAQVFQIYRNGLLRQTEYRDSQGKLTLHQGRQIALETYHYNARKQRVGSDHYDASRMWIQTNCFHERWKF